MAEIISKVLKVVDAVTDVLTEDIDSKQNTGIYKFEDFVKFLRENRKTNSVVEKSTISVTKVTEFDGVRYPEAKFLVRIVLLDKENRPIYLNKRRDEILGSVTIANSIDTKLAEFMGEKTKRTVGWKEGK